MAEVTICGWIILQSPEQFDDALAVVALDDVTQIDSKSTRVAEVVIKPLHGVFARIPFSLRVDASAVRASSSYSLVAEIRTKRNEELSRGNFLSTAAHPWSMAGDREATIAVQRI